MASFSTTIQSSLSQPEAFAYMAAFEHAAEWDPAVTQARRLSEDEVGHGTEFAVVSRFAGREVELRYSVTRFEPPRVVELEAHNPSFRSHDRITVEPSGDGSVVRYEAELELRGVRRLLDPLMQAAFERVGRAAEAGMREALNPR